MKSYVHCPIREKRKSEGRAVIKKKKIVWGKKTFQERMDVIEPLNPDVWIERSTRKTPRPEGRETF